MGYEGTDEEKSWLPATELDHAQELVTEFHVHYLCKPGNNYFCRKGGVCYTLCEQPLFYSVLVFFFLLTCNI